MERWGALTFDAHHDLWMIHWRDHQEVLRCGEWFGLAVGRHSIPCRLERDSEWCIVMPGARFHLRIRDTYKVEI